MPEGVIITSLQHEDIEAHDQTICSVSEPKLIVEEEEEEEGLESGDSEADGEDQSEGSDDSKDGDSKEE